MDLALIIYGINVLGNVNAFLSFLLVFTIVGTLLAIAGAVNHDGKKRCLEYSEPGGGKPNEKWFKEERNWKKAIRMWILSSLTGAIVIILLPSEKVAYMMLAGHTAQKISQSEVASEVGQKLLNILHKKLNLVEEDLSNKDR